MPAVSTYSLTGDKYVDGVLGDVKWAAGSFTYSFPTSGSFYGTSYGGGENMTNFGAMSATQQTAVRLVLAQYSAVANVTFAKVTESSTTHADFRFALSDAPGTAWAYFPTTLAEGGDAWFNKSSGYYNNPAKGNYAYTTVLHEFGHAMGLEHAHEKYVMPVDRDSMEYTVMSYRSYVGGSTSGGYTNETGGYAQSLMMYDIAALQHMYGANFNTNSGNTVYTWSPTTGEAFINGVGQGAPVANRIFHTIWDGGGIDSYDFSNYTTNLTVSLQPGEWTTTSATQLAKLHWDGSKVAVGNIANALQYMGDARSLIENATGGSGNDVLVGNQAANNLTGGAGADRLTGGAGADVLDGGAGTDTAIFTGLRSQYAVALLADGSLEIVDLRTGVPDGRDLVWNVETFQFSDKVYTLQEITSTTTVTPPPTPPTDAGLTLVGDNNANTLTGGSNADTLDGKGGSDKLYGNAGDDMLIGGAGGDSLDGGAGVDTASYATAAAGVTASLVSPRSGRGDASLDTFISIENLTGSAFADTLTGDDAFNVLTGGGGADKLYGVGGNDSLRGGDGDDFLYGGIGADALFGGAGSDAFVFEALGDSRSAARDTIFDFMSGQDKIDLRSIDANNALRNDQAFSFIGGGAFSGKAGQLNFIDGVVSGDVNGDKIADFHIQVIGISVLSASDFYL